MSANRAQEFRLAEAYDLPLPPTEAGQVVRSTGRSGQVTSEMEWGRVVRFTRAGNAVIEAQLGRSSFTREVTDYAVCFRRYDDEAKRWIRPSNAEDTVG